MLQHSDEAAHAVRWKPLHASEELETVACPLCDTDDPHPIATEWGLRVVRCGSCDTVYVSPRLKHPERSYWDEAETKRAKYGAILRGSAPHPRDANYLEHLSMIRRVQPTGRFLDVGAHCGFFLRLARGQGWNLEGVDPSPSSAQIAREAFGLEVHPCLLHEANFASGRFSVVTLVDVLEHVTAPRELVRETWRILAPGGVTFIKVPHARYNLLKLRLLKQVLRLSRFDIFDSREHVVHYTPATLKRLLEHAGFNRIDFYVPRPIQAGAWWQRGARSMLYAFARGAHATSGRISSAATDLAVIARK